MLFSFNQSALTSLPLTGLTFDWYRRLFAQRLFLAGAAEQPHRRAWRCAVLSVVTGTLAALALARMPQRRADRASSHLLACR